MTDLNAGLEFGFLSSLVNISFPKKKPPIPPAAGWDITLVANINTNGPLGSYLFGPNVYAFITTGSYFSNVVKLPMLVAPNNQGYSINAKGVSFSVSNPAFPATDGPELQLWILEDYQDVNSGDFRTYGSACSSIPYPPNTDGSVLPTLSMLQTGAFIEDIYISGQATFTNSLGSTYQSAPLISVPFTRSMSDTIVMSGGLYIPTVALQNAGLCVATSFIFFDGSGNPEGAANTIFDFESIPPAGASNYFGVVFNGGLSGTLSTGFTGYFGGQTGIVNPNGTVSPNWYVWADPSQLPPAFP